MNRMSKWIQERKAYSNPLFGAMLIVSGMVFPVFHAAAAIEEPVQPMAQTAEQVVDALNAVEAGFTVEQAFAEQPLPFREWSKAQKIIYETLFGLDYDIEDAAYILDDEVSELDENSIVTGTIPAGNSFDLNLLATKSYDYTSDINLSDDDVNALASANVSILPFIGKISTTNGVFGVGGVIFQATRSDGGRNRIFIITNNVDSHVIDDLEEYYQIVFAVESPQSGQTAEELNCSALFLAANLARINALINARDALDDCMDDAVSELIGDLGDCLGTGAVAGVVAILTGATGPIGAAVALVIGGGCMVGEMVDFAGQMDSCGAAFAVALAAARAAHATAIAAARAEYGDENCPGDPV
jgi:hypothetical protein